MLKIKFAALAALTLIAPSLPAAQSPGAADFKKKVQPLLAKYCADCHEGGVAKGKIDFDAMVADHGSATNHEVWLKVIKNLRSGLMPPLKNPRPSVEERKVIEDWIKFESFGIDPKNPDPGRVTVRRLNRVEYRNTVRDLLGVDYDTATEFPPDDTGYGFDDIADVLTTSPMLLEKYLNAAKAIVTQVVPTVGGVIVQKDFPGRQFHLADGSVSMTPNDSAANATNGLTLSYYKDALISNTFTAEHPGHYELWLDLVANEKYVENTFDYNKCQVNFKVDGEELLTKEFVREGGKPMHFTFEREFKAGDHLMTFELHPTSTNTQIRSLSMRLNNVTVRGPMEEKYFVRPKNYERFFPKGDPGTAAGRHDYAAELLGAFAQKAYRRPVDRATVDRLVALAESIYTQPHQAFEAGVAQGMVAVLASPRFLFREETAQAAGPRGAQPLLDEYALASRLSYFLWSTMPDEQLFQLAASNQLRQNLPAQVRRMLADPKSEALMQNFAGQWLQARDIETVPIDVPSILARDNTNAATGAAGVARRGGGLGRRGGGGGAAGPNMDPDTRRAMRRETEMYFGYVVREDRPVTELIESDYTFLNDRLARQYGITNEEVTGSDLRKVTLPVDNPRGGVLTMGTVLAVTSNPTRTSPVKRGLFILDNILGAPPPPPPANIPPLEDSEKDLTNHTPTLREVLQVHRDKAACASCHNRLDPPGLALENFNAMGVWREKEHGHDIEAAGTLITGEAFKDIREVKHILATDHRIDFYRTLAEKLLTYALGRGLEYYDTQTVDQIVDSLDKSGGRSSALLMGVIESAPFEKRRENPVTTETPPAKKATQERADLRKAP